jgi:hypothetical protein
MWILLQLALAYTADIDQLLYDVKIHSVKIRSEMDKFEKTHTKTCDKIVNRLRYMADAEGLTNKMTEHATRFRKINNILRRERSVGYDSKVGLVRDNHKEIIRRYLAISTNYHQCLAKWPDPVDRRKLAGR